MAVVALQPADRIKSDKDKTVKEEGTADVKMEGADGQDGAAGAGDDGGEAGEGQGEEEEEEEVPYVEEIGWREVLGFVVM